jgi:hypothetical protein
MYSPRGSVHAFRNPHDRQARALVILTPDIGAQYFATSRKSRTCRAVLVWREWSK